MTLSRPNACQQFHLAGPVSGPTMLLYHTMYPVLNSVCDGDLTALSYTGLRGVLLGIRISEERSCQGVPWVTLYVSEYVLLPPRPPYGIIEVMANLIPQQSRKSWLAFAAILGGFLLTAIGGLLVLSWVSSAAASAADATPLPVAQTPSAELTAQQRSTPTRLPDTPTALPTRPKPTEAASKGLTATPAQDLFQLTVIHTNDTWGYIEPCG